MMRTVDYGRFQDEGFIDHLGLVGKGLSLLFEKGIYEGRYLHAWLDGLLTNLGKRTFADLRIDDPKSSLPPEKAYRLVVMASDVTRGELVRLPWDYPRYGLKADDQLVADAVRASMSIPFFYEPVQLKWRDAEGNNVSYMVDGGMLSNFPIEVFDRTDGERPRWPTFGIKLSAKPNAGAVQQVRRQGDVRSRPRDGRDDDELPRPDAHRRPVGARPHDVRRHREREGDRLRHRRGYTGETLRPRTQGRHAVPRRMGLRAVHQDLSERASDRSLAPTGPGSCGRRRVAERPTTVEWESRRPSEHPV